MSAHILSVAEIAALAAQALRNHGASESQAAALAAGVAGAERDGLRSHGLMHLLTHCEDLTCGKVVGQALPVLSRAAPASPVVDARSGFAHAAIDLGLPALVAAAVANGVASLAIRNSYNCWCWAIIRSASRRRAWSRSASPTRPPRSRPGALGRWRSAPIPGRSPSLTARAARASSLTCSASVVAKSEVMKHARAGEPIPEGWAFARESRPPTPRRH